MAGFFGLFGGKKNKSNEPQSSNSPSEKGAFFLNSDDAKTLGDIDYMRKSKTTRRTFPTTLKGKGGELVQEVSALEIVTKKGKQVSSTTSTPQSSFTTKSQSASTKNEDAASQRRRADSGMDMFRKMAKEIKK